MNTKNCGCSSETCGCCEGVQALTPTANRPGLQSLRYRIGTHGAFLETMKARLSAIGVTTTASDGQTQYTARPLQKLTTRDAGDFSIALLDGWATVADVLTFYQERIANEAYLRTATERRSVLELANLVGYQLRPGVAASVYLAYTVDNNQKTPVPIDPGARAQSVPGPGELPQMFETAEPLLARAEWSNLQARVTRPQVIAKLTDTTIDTDTLYFQGIGTGLKTNDPLLLDFDPSGQVLLHVKTVEVDFTNNQTKVVLQESVSPANQQPIQSAATAITPTAINVFDTLVKPLSQPPTPQVRSSAFLPRTLDTSLGKTSDSLPQLASLFSPAIADTIYPAWSKAVATPAQPPKCYALRVKASPFGSTAPLRPVTDDQGKVVSYQEWPLAGSATVGLRFNFFPAVVPNILRNAATTSTPIFVEFTSTEGFSAVTVQKNVVEGNTVSLTGSWTVTIDTYKSQSNPNAVFSFSNGNYSSSVAFTADAQTLRLSVMLDNNTWELNTGQSITFSNTGTTVHMEYTENSDVVFSQMLPLAPNPKNIVDLDAQYDSIAPDTWVVAVRSDQTENKRDKIPNPLISKINTTQAIAKTAYNISGKSTELTLAKDWLGNDDLWLSSIRETTVYAQSEELQLSDMPVSPDASGKPVDIKGNTIELQRLYDGLQSGRWIIVSGERTDVKNPDGSTVEGVNASELAMIAAVSQAPSDNLPGDAAHTTLTLAKPLAHTYKLETVSIYANVVKATHGSTTNPPEILGAGDSSQALQTFALKQPPLTFVPASNPSGVDSTLKVYVNNVAWTETDSLAGLGPKDRNFVTKTDDNGTTSVIFGNGVQGARLPTGLQNVQAVYRTGIGKPGNVKAGQISLLQTRPLGVNAVSNPLAASGGADKESRDQARGNAPLAVMALDRLVSVQDYADFTRTFAGIGKASARKLSDGRRQLVHITIAGADDIPIDTASDLYQNLLMALRQLGDPDLGLQVELRELIVLVLSANIRLVPGYLWEPVKAAVTAAILDAFGFQRRALGQSALLCELVALMQNTAGVDYVNVLGFNGIPEKQAGQADGGTRKLLTLTELSDAALGKSASAQPQAYISVNLAGLETDGSSHPAQLAIFTSAVPDTIVLNQIS